ncbi:antibiotic transporter [Streptomyces albus]|uniref:Antibiotic transporter n=1 Tax=Streptomyces albus (strain ATCC 21838 / DSM 41398 / FERM P-419 / JCM 4703 / NBRC 107858) TaxID=1081613 RepID=A0A0B5ERH8_STRA4|nr:antibiotic transporter [Streptomyces albus]AOU78551.1 antibiotic transporter [Streptomyces albus]AYN34295.1 antibiotic transporter [Streptomyces albus]
MHAVPGAKAQVGGTTAQTLDTRRAAGRDLRTVIPVVLAVPPLVTMAQLGVLVGLGVLLDTFLVRTVLVPALALDLGRRFWWPGPLSRTPSRTPPLSPSVHRDHAICTTEGESSTL